MTTCCIGFGLFLVSGIYLELTCIYGTRDMGRKPHFKAQGKPYYSIGWHKDAWDGTRANLV